MLANTMSGSEILRIAAQVRALQASGHRVCDLTVGDFNPAYFPIPLKLTHAIQHALERGETNYPPSSGMLDLREAIRRYYARDLGLIYPIESILVVSGSRPGIYAAYRTLVDPGERVIYPVPSWNNNHYVSLVGGVGVPLVCRAEHRFMPTPDAVINALPGARLVCLNSPLNPTGTAISREALAGICGAVLAENRQREARGERPVFLLYDQVYWKLCFGRTQHVTPMEIASEMARYTILVDGINKAFAATGVRVGWAVGPVDIIERMSAVVAHVGAWAPRVEQVATAQFLDDPTGPDEFLHAFRRDLQERLDMLHQGVQSVKALGLPVDSIPPMGAIYLAARIAPFGRRTPQGTTIQTNEDVRTFMLERAGVGVVPFQAFGVPADDGWFRLSVGAVGKADIQQAVPRLAEALRSLR
jgi:aspartate aminotransferase